MTITTRFADQQRDIKAITTKQQAVALRATLNKLVNFPCANGHDCDDDIAIELIQDKIEELEG